MIIVCMHMTAYDCVYFACIPRGKNQFVVKPETYETAIVGLQFLFIPIL